MNIRFKAIGFSLAFTLIPLGLLGTAAFLETGRILREKLSVSTENAVAQVAARIDFLTADVEDLSLYMVQEAELRQLLTGNNIDGSFLDSPKARVENSLRALAHSKDYIHSIYIERSDGFAVNPQNTPNQISAGVVALARARPGAAAWFVDTVEDYAFSRTGVLGMTRVLRDVAYITRHLGYVRINISLPSIEDIFAAALESNQDSFALLHEGRVVASVGYRSDDPEFLANAVQSPGDPGLISTSVRLDRSGTQLAYVQFFDAAVPETRRVLSIMGAVMLASLSIYAVVATAFLRRLITPIRRLRDSMSRLEGGDFDISLAEDRKDEIGLLVSSFNRMAGRLKHLVNKVYTSELRLREAELSALQNQINPHFLYNTLDMLYWASRLESAPQTGEMIQALSRLFRYTLGGGKATTTVDDEVAHLESYLTIQRSVYEENIEFEVDVDQESLNYKTVRLVLQPLVENAIHHGVEASGGKGRIRVAVRRVDDNLEFCVSDSGPGFDPQTIPGLLLNGRQTQNSVGMKNVHERVRLVFGDEYGLVPQNGPGGGALVVVRQPAIEAVHAQS